MSDPLTVHYNAVHKPNLEYRGAKEFSPEITSALRSAMAQDAELLAALSDREPTAELLERLRSVSVDDWLGFNASSEIACQSRSLLSAALNAMPSPIDAVTLDELAADFAAIYLIHSYRAPPTESPWLDKDQLERQEPMFALAAWYRRFGLAAENRQRRSEDHMVLQLQFLAHLLSTQQLSDKKCFAEVSRFLDQHLLCWIGDFAERVAARCATPYFCGVVTLTHGYLESLRTYLADQFDLPRAVPEGAGTDMSKSAPDEEAGPYIPGVAPSW